jgi:hypothetical protein
MSLICSCIPWIVVVRAAKVSLRDRGIGTCGMGFVVARALVEVGGAEGLMGGITAEEEAANGGTTANGTVVEARMPEDGSGADMVSDTRLVETKDRRLYRWVIGDRGLKARRRTGGAVLGARG